MYIDLFGKPVDHEIIGGSDLGAFSLLTSHWLHLTSD